MRFLQHHAKYFTSFRFTASIQTLVAADFFVRARCARTTAVQANALLVGLGAVYH
jgi:hypothetical protein